MAEKRKFNSAEIFRRIRKEVLGLSQEKFAEQLIGVNPDTIGFWEAGLRPLPNYITPKITEYLKSKGIDITNLIESLIKEVFSEVLDRCGMDITVNREIPQNVSLEKLEDQILRQVFNREKLQREDTDASDYLKTLVDVISSIEKKTGSLLPLTCTKEQAEGMMYNLVTREFTLVCKILILIYVNILKGEELSEHELQRGKIEAVKCISDWTTEVIQKGSEFFKKIALDLLDITLQEIEGKGGEYVVKEVEVHLIPTQRLIFEVFFGGLFFTYLGALIRAGQGEPAKFTLSSSESKEELEKFIKPAWEVKMPKVFDGLVDSLDVYNIETFLEKVFNEKTFNKALSDALDELKEF